ncbi:MAG: hypothetical protein J3Q66DRAFT_9815 [Benniella sp.]|nr:MAG: hypothetical protein J3Q66DRAFT_9815 [Benniella sp.]
MSSAAGSSSADPRRPDLIVEYKPEVKRIEDDEPDVHGFVAVCAAVVGLMIRNRTCLWVGTIFSVESYLNQRASEGGLMGSPGATIMYVRRQKTKVAFNDSCLVRIVHLDTDYTSDVVSLFALAFQCLPC